MNEELNWDDDDEDEAPEDAVYQSDFSTATTQHQNSQASDDDRESMIIGKNGSQVHSQMLPNGKRIKFVIEDDPEAEQAHREQQEAALLRNMELNHVEEEYKKNASEIYAMIQYANSVLNSKTKEIASNLYAYVRETKLRQTYEARGAEFRVVGRCATLGIIQVASLHDYHNQLLEHVAIDAENDNVCTFVECPDTAIGIRLCVRLRYGSFVRIPTEAELDEHILLASKLAEECFPNRRDYTCFASTCCPRLKAHNVEPSHKLHMLRFSMQIVWPHIVVNSIHHLETFWATLDLRISEQNPFFFDVVDFGILVHFRVAMLPLYSHKVKSCETCSVSRTEKRDYDSSEDEDESNRTRLGLGLCTDCSDTRKKVTPIIYKPFAQTEIRATSPSQKEAQFDDDDDSEAVPTTLTTVLSKDSFTNDMSKLEQLQNMSIVPTYEQSALTQRCEWPFAVPKDAVDPTLQPYSYVRGKQQMNKSLLYESELQEQRERARCKTNKHIDAQTFPEIYQLCTKVIRLVHENYQFVQAERITVITAKKFICVDVRGRNSSHCMLHGGEHPKNRIYFQIWPKINQVSVCCYDQECKRLIKLFRDIKLFEAKPKSRSKFRAIEPPVGTLSPQEQITLATMLEVAIPYTTGYRELLCPIVGLAYTGNTRTVTRLVQDSDRRASSVLNTNEPHYYDKSCGLKLPHSFFTASMEEKKEYINSRPIAEEKKCAIGISTSGYVPAVIPKPFKTAYESYPKLTLEERKDRYQQELKRKNVLMQPLML